MPVSLTVTSSPFKNSPKSGTHSETAIAPPVKKISKSDILSGCLFSNQGLKLPTKNVPISSEAIWIPNAPKTQPTATIAKRATSSTPAIAGLMP